jgi:hypothetical protein
MIPQVRILRHVVVLVLVCTVFTACSAQQGSSGVVWDGDLDGLMTVRT